MPAVHVVDCLSLLTGACVWLFYGSDQCALLWVCTVGRCCLQNGIELSSGGAKDILR